METTSFIKNGVLQLPPGFRFHPTDEELVVQYLKRKVMLSPLPAAVIPEINLRKLDPWDLPGVNEGARYFFNLRETTYQNRSLSSWATPTGYWKTAGKIKPVVSSCSNELVGVKKLLIFHRGKPPHRSPPTDWIMHEYHCLDSIGALSSTNRNGLIHSCATHCKDWVVCCIFKKRAPSYTVGRVKLSTCSSSSSSCITNLDEEEGDGVSSSSINPPEHGRVP